MPRPLGDVLLAVVLGAHGLKGEVRVKTFTATPEQLSAYGPLHGKDGRAFTVKLLRPGVGAAKAHEAVVGFAEITDRNAAEAMKGTELFVARTALPEAETDEFYHADLIGLDADDGEGRRIGKVLSVQNYGAGDVLVLVTETGDEIWLAFTRENVPEIDVKGGRIIVAVPDEIVAGPEGGSEAEIDEPQS
ncbi:MAG: ribosome maturation factor RimM [Rhizomicrobium sp.]|nr:ribosome maturation factor RimM [Rhizomicrobium sp.]